MFRHIRSKLIAAFAVPLAILVAVAGLEAVSSLNQVNGIGRQGDLARASVAPAAVVQALLVEREYAVLDVVAHGVKVPAALAGVSPAAAGLTQSPGTVEGQSDQAATAFRATLAGLGTQAQQDYSNALVELSTLPVARREWGAAAAGHAVASPAAVATHTYNEYTSIINALVNGTDQVPVQVSDPTLRTGAEALYTSLAKATSQYQALEDVLAASWQSGPAQKAALSQAFADWGADQALGQRLVALATGPYVQALDGLYGNGVDKAISFSLQQLQAGGAPNLAGLLQAFAATNRPGSPSAMASGDAQVASVVNARASSLRTTALEKTIGLGAAAVLGMLIGLALAIAASRSISRPLVELARQAEQANEVLPATVQAILDGIAPENAPEKRPRFAVHSKDEVGEMARALEAVNKTAIELATGQAALRRSLSDAFINLGRRNQNLVTRQLEYISEIEIKEADPESLEELFRLDHLATRMRRNAESLLILAGSGPARQWSAAVPAMDVARAASAEVEDYKRLRLHHFDQAMIAGAATTDLVHIMSELTENALTFSPPGSPVDIYGRYLDGGYVIVIVDSGIGMSAEDLDLANRRLSGEGSDADVPGRYLGHFVAGRLARRHGIAISLQASHSGGLVARVKIPSDLIEDTVPDLSAGAEPRSNRAASPAAYAPQPTFSGPDAFPPGMPFDQDTPFEPAAAFNQAAPYEQPVPYQTPSYGATKAPFDHTDLLLAAAEAYHGSRADGHADGGAQAAPPEGTYGAGGPAAHLAPEPLGAPATPAGPLAYQPPAAYVPPTPAYEDRGRGTTPGAAPSYSPSSAAAPAPFAPASYSSAPLTPAHSSPATTGPAQPSDGHETFAAPALEGPALEGPAFAGASIDEPASDEPAFDEPALNEPALGAPPVEPTFGAHAGEPPVAEAPEPATTYQPERTETAPKAELPSWINQINKGYYDEERDNAAPAFGATKAAPPAPVGVSPVGASPVGASPVGASPVGASPVGVSPVGASPASNSPVGSLPRPGPNSAGVHALGQQRPETAGSSAPTAPPFAEQAAADPALGRTTAGQGAPPSAADRTLNLPPRLVTDWATPPQAGPAPGAAPVTPTPSPAPVPSAPVRSAPVASAPVPSGQAASAHAGPAHAAPADAAPAHGPSAPATPDLGAGSPLVSGRPPAAAPARTSWDPVAPAATAPNGAQSPRTSPPSETRPYDARTSGGPPPGQGRPAAVGPAEQARSTADGLRKLTKRVPGASLPEEDSSLRRATPATTPRNPAALTGALSQYLSATMEGRSEKEPNGR